MKSSIPTLAIALGAGLASAQRLAGTDCDDVHVFIAKGNNEGYPGRQGKLVSAICDGLENCDYEDVRYYNPVGSPYCASVAEGASSGVAQITEYNARCPDTKLVVSGYSQGAQIIGDVLGGGGGRMFNECDQPANAGISANSAAGKKIVAALIFGDVRHTANQPYNFLDGNGNGAVPRPANQLIQLNGYADRLRSYCDATDPVCNGGDVVANHLNYFDRYSESSAAWVKSLIKAAPSNDDNDDSESSARPTSVSVSSTATAPAPTLVLPPTYGNGSIITTTICPEFTSAIDAVATSWYSTVSLTFAPGPSGTAGPSDVYVPGPSDVYVPGASATPSTVPTAGASTLQRSGLGLAVLLVSAFAML